MRSPHRSKEIVELPTELTHEDVEQGNLDREVKTAKSGALSRIGLSLLVLLAFQNTFKNLLLRAVMKGQPKFLYSTAVLGSECIKLSLSLCYILFVSKRNVQSIVEYLREDSRNTMLLAVPASAYNLNMSLEYVALANLDAALFSIAIQTKLLFTASFAVLFLRKKLKYIQLISLFLLMSGVMLCNLDARQQQKKAEQKHDEEIPQETGSLVKGLMAVLTIAVSSGFASVFTEKVIKSQRRSVEHGEYGLAYTQVQLALMSLLTMGAYALWMDYAIIAEHGFFYNFTPGAFLSILASAIGGLVVASVLKYADSILKNYATAMSVVMTGTLSMLFFGTRLGMEYFLGMTNVIAAIFLYNGQNLNEYVCTSGA